MSTVDEIKNIPEKFSSHINKLIALFNEYEIDGVVKLVKIYKSNKAFENQWKQIWIALAEEDGGKISLTAIGIIIGTALGGVGIAAMGSAIGMPLALVLGLGGFLSGSKIDSLSFFSNEKSVKIKLPIEVIELLENDANETGLSINQLIEHLVKTTYFQNT